MEHHANIVPWHFLRERQGAVIKWAPVDDDGNFLIDEFEKLLTDRTKMVAITQMSNVLGTVVPVKEVVRIAHAPGDSGAGRRRAGSVHLDVDVRDIDCDFYVITGHKLYGPTGIGALYGKHEHLAAMPPFNGGGEMIREVRGMTSPMASRRTGSRPARRRSCRRSGLAPPSTTSTRSARAGSGRMSIAARLRPGEAARDQFVAHHRDRGRQGRDRLVRDEERPCPRFRHRDRPPASRCGPAPIAPCRFWNASVSRPPAGRRSLSTIPMTRSTIWCRR